MFLFVFLFQKMKGMKESIMQSMEVGIIAVCGFVLQCIALLVLYELTQLRRGEGRRGGESTECLAATSHDECTHLSFCQCPSFLID
jgi:hypothetical protein